MSVACSVLGSCLAACFATARTTYVAAREGHLNQVLAMIHVHRLTPAPAIITTVSFVGTKFSSQAIAPNVGAMFIFFRELYHCFC